MTLVIMPWDITDYDGTGIITQGMDHIGFKVESVDAFKADVERIAGDNPRLAPAPIRPARRARRSTSCSSAVAPWASTASPIPTAS